MAYGQSQSVTITVKTDSLETICFCAEPSCEAGQIGLAERQLKQATKATFSPDFCEACLQFLDIDMELEFQNAISSSAFLERVRKEYLRLNNNSAAVETAEEQFYALPMQSKLMVLEEDSFCLDKVYKEYLLFRDAMEKEVSSIDRIDSVEFAWEVYCWGFGADEAFVKFYREFLPYSLFLKYDAEDFWEAEDDSEPIKELKEELDKLFGKKLFLECRPEDLIRCFRSPDLPGYFIGERIYKLNMKSNQIEKTWKITACEE